MRWLFATLLIASCGRVNFDPLVPAGGDGNTSGDGNGTGDGGTVDGDGRQADGSTVDALAAACAEAIAVTVNVPITMSTCATGLDRVDGCAGPALNELVFKFVVPTSGGYTVKTAPAGTMNVITTGDVNAACSGNAGCFALSMTNLTPGQTRYYVVEASQGNCQSIDFSVTMP